jgi:hypothetical protein
MRGDAEQKGSCQEDAGSGDEEMGRWGGLPREHEDWITAMLATGTDES